MAGSHLAAGREALARGAWDEARPAFEEALRTEETPEALEGLGVAARWLNDSGTAFEAHERAFRLYRRVDDRRGAARMAYMLALHEYNFRSDIALAAGWLERAQRLLEGVGRAPERGWIAGIQAHVALLVEHDVEAARRLAGEAARIGRELGDLDLEMLALGLEGLLLVSEGRVDEGMRRLDEATTAAVAGELTDLDAIESVCCYQIYACKRVRDFDRAAQWCDRVKEISEQWADKLMFAVCRTHYADVLLSRGAWAEAEEELDFAARELGAANKRKVVDALVRLGELRRRQGRLEEAAALFREAEAHPLAALGRAALALDQADPESGAELVERFLRRISTTERTERVAGLELLVRARAALGDVAAARDALAELESIAADIGTEPLQASVSLARGLVHAAAGEDEAARRSFEDAVDLFEESGAPFETAQARQELARALRSLGRYAAAEEEARTARKTLAELGAALERKTGREPDPHGLTRRELEVLRLVARGLSNQDIAGELVLSVRTVERHISNIYDKIGASGKTARAAAAAYAAGRALA